MEPHDLSTIPAGMTYQRLVDFRQFKTACYAAAQGLRGRVIATSEPGSTPNYFTASFDLPDGSVTVLCNCALPRVAFCHTLDPGAYPKEFVDHPALAAIMLDCSFQSIPADVLNASIGSVDTSKLEPVEIKDLAYWRPQTVGQLLFNHFD